MAAKDYFYTEVDGSSVSTNGSSPQANDRPSRSRRVSNLIGRFEQLSSKSPKKRATATENESGRPNSESSPRTSPAPKKCQDAVLQAKLHEEVAQRAHITEQYACLRTAHEQDQTTIASIQKRAKEREQAYRTLSAQHETLNEECSKLQTGHRELETRLRASESRAREMAVQADELRRQMLDLKQSISTSARVPNQVTDQELAQGLNTLNHEIQNWVVQYFRKVKIDPTVDMHERFESVPFPDRSAGLQAAYRIFDNSQRLAVFQSTVVHFMMQIFENGKYFGLPGQEGLQSIPTLVEAFRSPSAAYKQWHSLTFEMVNSNEGIHETTEAEETRVTEQIDNAMRILTATEPSGVRLKSLHSIVKRATSISRLCHVQLAQYTFVLPNTNAFEPLRFDASTMEDMHGESESELDGYLVKCVVFPAVIKTGDEHGENTQLQNVIMKAKVLCVEPKDATTVG